MREISVKIIAAMNTDTLSSISGGVRTRIFQSYGKNVTKLDDLKTHIENALSDGDFEKVASLRKEYVGITEKLEKMRTFVSDEIEIVKQEAKM